MMYIARVEKFFNQVRCVEGGVINATASVKSKGHAFDAGNFNEGYMVRATARHPQFFRSSDVVGYRARGQSRLQAWRARCRKVRPGCGDVEVDVSHGMFN